MSYAADRSTKAVPVIMLMDVVFSVCIVMRGPVGSVCARVWEV